MYTVLSTILQSNVEVVLTYAFTASISTFDQFGQNIQQFCHKGNLNPSVCPSWSAVVIHHHHVLQFIYFVSLEKKSVSV